MRIGKAFFLALTWLAVTLIAAAAALGGEVTVYTVDGLENALRSASPGDRIYVAPGYYGRRLWVTNVHGQSGSMIEVVALDPSDRPVFESHSAACFTLYNCSYILVDGIIAQGAGTADSAGNNIEFPYGSHMILKNSLSRDITHDGNSDGVKFARSNNVLMYNCTVTEWGDGGSGVDGMVSNFNLYMRNTFTFPSLGGGAGANGIMPKGASYHNGIYKNHYIDGSSRAVCFGGSGGAAGPEVYDSVAMGNVIEAGEAAVAYVSCTDCEFAYNTVVRPEWYVMRILKEGVVGASDNIFRRNLVEYGNVTVQNIGGGNDAASFTYAENYWYKHTDPAHSIPVLAAPETDPAGGVDPELDAECRPLYDPAKAYGAHAPGMEDEWAQYTGWFQWAWEQAQEYEPDARAGGGYNTAPGFSITLDATASRAGRGSYGEHQIVAWQWDLDADGVFDDASGETVELSCEDLTGSGPGQIGLPPGRHTVELRITSANEYGTIVDWGRADLLILEQAVAGDANLDGRVDYLDLGRLAANYDRTGDWHDGDFNGDDLVDYLDLGLLATNYEDGGGQGAPAGAPEPGAILLLAAAAPLLLRRSKSVGHARPVHR